MQRPNSGEANHRPAKAGLALILSIISLIAVGGVAYFTIVKPMQDAAAKTPSTSGSDDSKPNGKVFALGRLQPKSGIVNIFGPPGDRVEKVNFPVGTLVKKGDVLFEFSGAKERSLAVETIKTQITESKNVLEAAKRSKIAKRQEIDAEIKKAESELKSQIAALRAKVEASKVQQSRAAAELVRLQTIRSNGVSVAQTDFLEMETLAKQANIELAALEEQQKLAIEQAKTAEVAMNAKIASFEAETDRALAMIPTDSLNAGLKVAEAKLETATIRAPFDGKIVKLAAHPGDTVATMPLMQIADPKVMVVIAEVYESDVGKLRNALATQGKSLTVEVDTRGVFNTEKKIVGTVTLDDISPVIAKNTVFALDPRGDSDRRVIEVEVKLDDNSSKAAANFMGLQVRAEFVLTP